MRKKDTLYRANKFNKALFMPDGNIFDIGGVKTTGLGNVYNTNPFNVGQGLSGNALLGLQKANNEIVAGRAFNLGAKKRPVGPADSGGINSMVGMAAGGIGATVGNMAGNAIAGDHELGGVDEVVTALQSANTGDPLIDGAKNLALGVVGGTVKRAFGMATDEEKLGEVNAGISQNNSFVSNAGSFDDIQGPVAAMTDTDVYKGGWFAGGSKARRKNEELRNRMINARQFAQRSVDNNIFNLQKDQLNNALANYAAFGGPIGTDDMGAVNYGFMNDYLTQKKRESDMKNKMAGIPSMPAFMPNSFAIGGDLQTNGADFSSGLTHINAGLSHEENPNDGVQLGVDSENVPNLVEEGETVWNDYVFSKRIFADEATKSLFKLPRKKNITFADISKKLEKEIAERPVDPISQAGFNAQMQQLEEQQERQKQEMEAERAKAAFEALSPEEQTAVMQRAAQEEQAAQQMAQQQAIAEQQAAMQQPSQEEIPMAQQQQIMQADGSEAALGQQASMMAEGGKVNKFEEGGDKKKRNVGTWKNDKENHWDIFTKPGLKKFLENLRQRINMAPDEDTKNAIRREAMNELNTLQQSYFSNVLPSAGATQYEYSDAIKGHQQMFDRLHGNTGFYTTDENGNVRNLIAEAINLPNGAATNDKPDNWADGYNGRRTSIRNFGSTEYGDDKYYRDLVDEFADLGLTYAPNENWQYGDNRLYGLSMPETEPAAEASPKVWDYQTGDWVNASAISAPSNAKTSASDLPPRTAPQNTDDSEERNVSPKHRAGWLRYAGLFGPSVGLGLQMAGVGRPDTSMLDAAITGAGNVALADYQPLGNYLTYRPLDRLFQQNQLNAQARATDRALVNTVSPSKAAGLLANSYNSQIASGNLFRQEQEYNDNLRKQVEEFNRGTDQFNAEAYNRTSQFNADAINRARQTSGQLRLNAAAQKMDADAGWYNGIYGNVAGLFKGIGDIGRENVQFNWLSDLAADGAFGNLGRSNTGKRWTKEKKAKGGKLKKRGLTI